MSHMRKLEHAWAKWCTLPTVSEEGHELLDEIAKHPEQLRRSFGHPLAIEDGRIGGPLGEGPATMNETMVAWLAKSFGTLMRHNDLPSLTVLLGGDGHKKQRDFLHMATEILTGMGLHVIYAPLPMPAPVFSESIGRFLAMGGIYFGGECHKDSQCMTFYNEKGAQVTDTAALKEIFEEHVRGTALWEARMPLDIAAATGMAMPMAFRPELTYMVDLLNHEKSPFLAYRTLYRSDQLTVLYSALYGSGRYILSSLLREGYASERREVKSQNTFNPEMPTVETPSVQEPDAYLEGLLTAYVVGPDILLLMEPAGRYIGVAVRHNGAYHILSGQQVALLIFDFISSHRLRQKGDAIVTAFGTSTMLKGLALHRGYEVHETDRHFAALGALSQAIEEDGTHQVMFLCDDRGGMAGRWHPYEADGLLATLCMTKAALAANSRNYTLIDRLRQLQEECGAIVADARSTVAVGAGAADVIAALSKQPAVDILGEQAPLTWDFRHGGATMPPLPMLHFQLSAWSQVGLVAQENDRAITIIISCNGEDAKTAHAYADQLLKAAKKAIQATDRRIIHAHMEEDAQDEN